MSQRNFKVQSVMKRICTGHEKWVNKFVSKWICVFPQNKIFKQSRIADTATTWNTRWNRQQMSQSQRNVSTPTLLCVSISQTNITSSSTSSRCSRAEAHLWLRLHQNSSICCRDNVDRVSSRSKRSSVAFCTFHNVHTVCLLSYGEVIKLETNQLFSRS